MTIELHLGWWLAPAAITALSLIGAVALQPKSTSNYDFGSAFIGLFWLAGAVIVSLVAWLAWAVAP